MDDHKAREIAARWSVGVGVVILVFKVTAWLLTGSLAVMSDALESVVHVGATIVMYVALRMAAAPPDRHHPFGHGKVGSFSVGFEGGLVASSGLLVFWMVVSRLFNPTELGSLGAGAAWIGAAAGVNLVLGLYLMRVARRTGSTILRADAHHVLADVWTSGTALIGLALVMLTNLVWIDMVVAVIAGIHLLVVGVRLVREAGSELLDSADEETLTQVVEVLNQHRESEWIDVHRLRVLRVGERRYVEFHLLVPKDWSVKRAHDVIERLEDLILERLGAEGAVNVHLDYPKDPTYESVPFSDFSVLGATRLNMADAPGPWHKADDSAPEESKLPS
ncbi:MAG: cation diffusion facilitator family transporter [Planctomycetota bacterium]|nr:cation diffusion facilitator family transporter [Planctomycetota bacterium]